MVNKTRTYFFSNFAKPNETEEERIDRITKNLIDFHYGRNEDISDAVKDEYKDYIKSKNYVRYIK